MHEHDHDLIMALAEETLSAAETEAAAAVVAACTHCARELRLQEDALRALTAAPTPQLTDIERQRLRHAVTSAVEVTPVTAPAITRRRWGIPALGIAAAAVLVTALAAGPLVSLLSTSSDDSADLSLAATTTSLAGDVAGSAAELAPPTESTTSADAVSGQSAPGLTGRAFFDPAPTTVENLGEVDGAALDQVLAKVIEGDAAAAPWLLESTEGTVEQAPSDPASCTGLVADAFAGARYTALIGTGETDGMETYIYSLSYDDGAAAVAAVDPETCEVVDYRSSSRTVTPLGTPSD